MRKALPVLMAAAVSLLQAQSAPPLPDKITPYPVVADIDYAEGPAFDSQGNLYFVNYLRRGTIARKMTDGTVGVWIDLGKESEACGLKVDGKGNVVVADYRGKRLLRISQDRRLAVLADSLEGQPLLGLNDVCLDKAGNIYFTTPFGSSLEHPIGAFYRYSAGGKLSKLDGGLPFPNGIAVSPDQKRIFVDDSRWNRVLVYELHSDGRVSDRRTFYQFDGGIADGMDFDEYGRLWVARYTARTVDVLDPGGKLVARIPAGGDEVTNLAWWGTQLFVTVAGQHSIHRLEVGVRRAQ